MKKLIKILFKLLAIVIILILLYSIVLSTKAKNICKVECEELGTEFYSIIKNGKWDIHDKCICWLPNDEIKTFIIE